MQVQMTVECAITVRAAMRDDGDVRVQLTGVVPYGKDRTASTTFEVKDVESLALVKDALEKVIAENGESCVKAALQGARDAEAVARRRGEI
jgi:hypothetical protein